MFNMSCGNEKANGSWYKLESVLILVSLPPFALVN